MKVLIACEFSGRVREAFRALGHDAWSCDILPADDNSPYHYQCDVLEVLDKGWDLMIAHPPCTYLSSVGNRHLKAPGRAELRNDAAEFFMALVNAPIEHIAVENPVGYMNTFYRKPDQIIHPYYFGEPFQKRTCLWLKNLPVLEWDREKAVKPEPLFYLGTTGKPINWVEGIKGLSAKERQHARNTTFQSIANAFAAQWGEQLHTLEKL